jgi:hypothetical protein
MSGLEFALGGEHCYSFPISASGHTSTKLRLEHKSADGAGPALNDATDGSRAETLLRRSFGKRNELPMHLARDRNADGAVSLTLLECAFGRNAHRLVRIERWSIPDVFNELM